MRMVLLERAELHHSKQRKGKKVFHLKSQQRAKMKASAEPCDWEQHDAICLDLSIPGEYYKYILVLK